MQRLRSLISTHPRRMALTWLGIFVVALPMSASSYDFGDPATFLARALGPILLSHESGHPLFFLIMHPVALLVGDAGMIVMNAALGALAMTLLISAGSIVCRAHFPQSSKSDCSQSTIASVVIVGSVVVVHTLMHKTTLLDVYALQAALIAAMLLAMVRIESHSNTKSNTRWFLFAGAIIGLQVAAHLWTAFSLPMYAVWSVALMRRRMVTARTLFAGAALALIASAAYTIPGLHVMASKGVGEWFALASGQVNVHAAVTDKFFGYALFEWPEQIGRALLMLVYQYPLVFWLAVPGFAVLWQRQRALCLTLAALFIANFVPSALYRENHAYELMLTHELVFFVFIAAGAPWVAARAEKLFVLIRRVRLRASLRLAAILVLPTGTLLIYGAAACMQRSGVATLAPARDFPFRDEAAHFLFPLHRGYDGPHQYGAAAERLLPHGAQVLADWSFYTVLARQLPERDRTDVTLIYLGSPLEQSFWDNAVQRPSYAVTGEALYLVRAARREYTLAPVGDDGTGTPVLWRVEGAKPLTSP